MTPDERRAAVARARSVRGGSPDQPAWATKWGEEPTWRRAALKASHDVLALERELQGRIAALDGLRSAWNAHMETCPQRAALPMPEPPSWEDLAAWRDAPSGTASA
jgi:hypothetical protein